MSEIGFLIFPYYKELYIHVVGQFKSKRNIISPLFSVLCQSVGGRFCLHLVGSSPGESKIKL